MVTETRPGHVWLLQDSRDRFLGVCPVEGYLKWFPCAFNAKPFATEHDAKGFAEERLREPVRPHKETLH